MGEVSIVAAPAPEEENLRRKLFPLPARHYCDCGKPATERLCWDEPWIRDAWICDGCLEAAPKLCACCDLPATGKCEDCGDDLCDRHLGTEYARHTRELKAAGEFEE